MANEEDNHPHFEIRYFPLETTLHMECPDCHGSGRILLLVTSTPCLTCGGSGDISLSSVADTLEEMPADGVGGGTSELQISQNEHEVSACITWSSCSPDDREE